MTQKKEKPKTIKKPKIDTKPSASVRKSTDSGKVKTNAEGDQYIDLGKKKRAVLRSFKGIPLLDIREYYGAEGEEKPGKKGISLQLEQWHELRDSASTIDQLFTQLKK
ncbi:transcriptional Coactivator p15-domain-containing protein [Crepidotus variabilis]|uniref:Transcriptional Coactivator p15-domain-containing protein n=1 Tax=Crepidotus variabilis TaxID=179855 RepID=A0A9P6JS77_9AGAR|nr:transcriptional Coactivator p15-domain-containing protein [Crepidotus variabilis]